jgi:hypothetical protein
MTPQQLATLKAYIDAQPEFAALTRNSDGAYAVAEAINQDEAAYFVWRDITSASDILDAIVWANLTPADAPDGTATFTNRALACQAKQLNLQILLQGREQLSTGRTNVRGALSDALTNVPAGAGGALLDAGWLGAGKVKTAITRRATRFEKLYATGTGTTGTPAVLTVVGPVAYQTIEAAWSV